MVPQSQQVAGVKQKPLKIEDTSAMENMQHIKHLAKRQDMNYNITSTLNIWRRDIY